MINKNKFNVIGMTCSACSANVTKYILKIPNIIDVNINLLANNMLVTYDDKLVTKEDIINAVKSAGYDAFFAEDKKNEPLNSNNIISNELKDMKKKLIISVLFMIPLFYISMGHMANWPLPAFFIGTNNAITFSFTQFLLCLPIIIVNKKYFTVGFKMLFKGSPNMDSLIAIGSTAAIVYGIYSIYKIGYGLGQVDTHVVHEVIMDLYFETAAMILTLITLGKYLEARSKGKTSEAITKLINLAPKTATILKEDKEIEIGIEDVVVGDLVIVKTGQTVPVDGVIVEGIATLDESSLTGESIPVDKNVSDKVIGSSINKSGYFIFRATKVGSDTALSQIIKLVEEASASKAPIAKLADKVSGVFVPIVIIIAILATIIWLIFGASFEFAMSIGIAILVISCPCALGLATPTAIMVGTGKAAQNGILIKSAEALELSHDIDTVVLDKTGTITKGQPQVTDIIPLNGLSEKDLIIISASIEKKSEHPLGNAIVNKAIENNMDLVKIDTFEQIVGRGLKVNIGADIYLAGNMKLMNDSNINISEFLPIADNLSENGKTTLYFAKNNNLIGIIALADVVKETSKDAISYFKSMGIDVIMLTGDSQKTSMSIQKQVMIETIITEVMPQDKENEIKRLQESGKKVAMIGDGVNDAPALARADVGIAIGAGTDVAIESADIVLMKSDLLDAVYAIQLSKSVIKNIKQNLFWAIIYNAIGIPLAAGIFYTILGWKLNPMFGAAAMSLSSVCVVSNALRLKFFKPVFNNIKYNNKVDKTENLTLYVAIDGMVCGNCQSKVDKALNSIDGVKSVNIDLDKKMATLLCETNVTNQSISSAIIDAGYTIIKIQR